MQRNILKQIQKVQKQQTNILKVLNKNIQFQQPYKGLHNIKQFQFSKNLKFDENGVLIEPTKEEQEEQEKNKKFSYKLSKREWLGLLCLAIGGGLSVQIWHQDFIQAGNHYLENREYQKVLDHNNNSWMWGDAPIAHYQRAIAYMGLNRLEEALTEINITLEKEQNFQSLRIKGHILKRLGQLKDADEYFSKSEFERQLAGIPAMENMQQQQQQQQMQMQMQQPNLQQQKLQEFIKQKQEGEKNNKQ